MGYAWIVGSIAIFAADFWSKVLQRAGETTDRWHESWWTDNPDVDRSINAMKKPEGKSIAQACGAPVASQTEPV